jgi:hypothetical protein
VKKHFLLLFNNLFINKSLLSWDERGLTLCHQEAKGKARVDMLENTLIYRTISYALLIV